MKSLTLKFVYVVFVYIVVFGCASGKRVADIDDTGDTGTESLDDFYGVSNDEESSALDSDEDEVLKLLGIKKEESNITEDTTSLPQEDLTYWKNKSTELERQISEKEMEIDRLQTELAEKDKKLEQQPSVSTSSAKATQYTPSGDFTQDYQVALSEYNNRNYKGAIDIFESLLMRDSNNSLADNCRYWIGESYYGLGNYKQAIVEFEKVLSYEDSNKKDDAQLKLGISYMKEGDRVKAREEFQRLISNFPDSEYVSKAQNYLSNL
ncbi:tetratricopeptide repeat protein [candidate division KSB1 bacterium]|nr:tetratricopeptide repeat protein [candidate division KSB1 bacterium]